MKTLAHLTPLVALIALMPAPAGAQPAAGGGAFDEDALRAYVSQQVAGAAGQRLTRFEVQIGKLDPRLVLAPCRRTEPFLPAGVRPWGRTSVGVRCADGANWSIMLAATVRAWGPALVAATPLAGGAILGAQDVREQEVELTREPMGLPRELAQVQGRTLVRSVNAGQALRADMLRTTPVVQAGDPVRLRFQGAGFAVTATGQALASAGEGQALRVRSDLGKILSGVAHEGRLVDVGL